jgi:hypothetical protein
LNFGSGEVPNCSTSSLSFFSKLASFITLILYQFAAFA